MGSAALLLGIYLVFGYFFNISCKLVIGNAREECRAPYPKDSCYISMNLPTYSVKTCEENTSMGHSWKDALITFKFIGGHQTLGFNVKLPGRHNDMFIWRSTYAYAFTEEDLIHGNMTDVPKDLYNMVCTIKTGSVREKSTFTCRAPNLRRLIKYYNMDRDIMVMFIETQNDGITVCEEPYRNYQQPISYSCPYTANATMTTKFKFMFTTSCGLNTTTEITLNVTETSTVPGKTSNASTDIDQRHGEKLFKDNDDISITCEDVTGSVGEELTLTCRVYYWNDACSIIKYRFIESVSNYFCGKRFNSYFQLQLTSLSCPYTAKAAMTTKFELSVDSICGDEMEFKTSEFNVNVTETSTVLETSTVSGKTSNDSTVIPDQRHGDELLGVKVTVGCLLPLIVIALAIIGVIVWTRPSQVNRFLKGYLRGRTTDTDSVSDQQMQRYTSSQSMDRPIVF